MKHFRTFRWWLAIAFVAWAGMSPTKVASSADDEHPVTTVSRVDLERYVGLWYEIAKIPNRFQKHCARGTRPTFRWCRNVEGVGCLSIT